MPRSSCVFAYHLGVVACIALATLHCSSTSSTTHDSGSTTGGATTGGTTTTPTGGTTGGGGTAPTTPTRTANAGGSASNQLSQNNSTFASLLSVNACASQDFNVYEVGGGGNVVARGQVTQDGNFSVQWQGSISADTNSVAEITLKFACATAATPTVRCFGKAGDAQIVCDPIANAIITALENSLGVNVESSTDFKGLSVSTLAQGLVETLKLASRLDQSVDYLTQLATATDPNTLASILDASPVGALFGTMQTVTMQTQVQNTAPTADGNSAKAAALQTLWTPDKVITLLTGLGINVTFNVDASTTDNGGPNIYGAISAAIDNATGATFMADFQTYLTRLYSKLYTGAAAQSSSISLLCVAQPQGGDTSTIITYPPDLSSSNANHITCTGPTAVALEVVNSNGQPPSQMNISAMIGSTFAESDRNDPDGTHAQTSTFGLQMGLVDIFEEIQTAISPNGLCAGIVNTSGDDVSGDDSAWATLGGCLASHNLGRYFSGAVGVHSFLTNPNLVAVRASFVDIYNTLVGDLALRLGANYPSFASGVSVTLSDAQSTDGQGSDQAQIWVPWLLLDTNTVVGGNEVYQNYCPAPLCNDNGLIAGQVSMTTAQFQAVLARTTPTFAGLFSELANMPSFSALRNWIFSAAHHVDYNTSGSHFYNIVGKDTNGDYLADLPVLCQAQDPNTLKPLASYKAGATIHCQVATGNWNNGVVSGGNYNQWLGLQWRNGTGAERYFALVDLYTGQSIQANGQEFRIRDISSQPDISTGVSHGKAVVADGTTLYSGQDLVCNYGATGSNQCYTENFSYVALNFPNSNVQADPNSFYPTTSFQPFAWPMQVMQIDPVSGTTHNLQTQVAATNGVHDSTVTNLANGYPLCINANGVATSRTNQGVATSVSLAGNVGNCSDPNFGGGTHYYLALTFDANSAVATANTYRYQLLRNDGLFMSSACLAFTAAAGDANQPTSSQPTGTSSQPTGNANQPTGNANQPTSNANQPVGNANQPTGNANQPAGGTAACGIYTLPLYTLIEPLNGVALFPSVSPTQALTYNIANPTYSPTFDPFCADLDGSGHCDCYRDNGTGTFNVHLTGTSTPTDANCNLADIPGDEPTFSDAPIASSDPSAPLLTAIMQTCGNLGGGALATCLQSNRMLLTGLNVNAQTLFGCATPVAGQTLTYVNLGSVVSDPNNAGGNCNPNHAAGPVKLYKIVGRDNAYDISRPQSALKLIATATQDSGTGVSIDPNAATFSFSEALALGFFRMTVPLDKSDVRGPSPSLLVGGQATAQVDYPGLQPTFTQLQMPGSKSSDVASAILRAFLNKTN